MLLLLFIPASCNSRCLQVFLLLLSKIFTLNKHPVYSQFLFYFSSHLLSAMYSLVFLFPFMFPPTLVSSWFHCIISHHTPPGRIHGICHNSSPTISNNLLFYIDNICDLFFKALQSCFLLTKILLAVLFSKLQKPLDIALSLYQDTKQTIATLILFFVYILSQYHFYCTYVHWLEILDQLKII